MQKKYMERAILLAQNGIGRTNPNPLVGAVIVKDGEVIGEGYHEQYGGLHAERNALANCIKDPEGATLYVTLEPCCHHGKTPPCTEAILEHKIKKVVIGSRDPNPLVAGKGAAILKEAGVEVVEDYMKEACDAINPVFFHYIQTKQPYVAMKYAMTADGKIATKSGNSQWITSKQARDHVHYLRNYYKGIMVGIGTVIADDPMLTCRGIDKVRDPIRIVCDSHLQIPLHSKLVQSAKQVPLVVACLKEQERTEKAKQLEKMGAQMIFLPPKDGHISMKALLCELGEQGIDGILAEGGGMIHGTLMKEKLVQCVYAYVGAKLFGESRYTPVRGSGIDQVAEGLELTHPEIQLFSDDVLIKYKVKG